MKILIVDDNADLVRSLVLLLSAAGHDAQYAGSAESAIVVLENNAFDFILVDYKMPVNDGIWFMKNANIPKSTKVLLMTAFVNRVVIAEMFKLGAVGYLIKPFDGKELLRHLKFHSQPNLRKTSLNSPDG